MSNHSKYVTTMGGQKKVAPSNYNTGIGIYDV